MSWALSSCSSILLLFVSPVCLLESRLPFAGTQAPPAGLGSSLGFAASGLNKDCFSCSVLVLAFPGRCSWGQELPLETDEPEDGLLEHRSSCHHPTDDWKTTLLQEEAEGQLANGGQS